MSETLATTAQDPPISVVEQAISDLTKIDPIPESTPDTSTLLMDENMTVPPTMPPMEDQSEENAIPDPGESLVVVSHHEDHDEQGQEQFQQQVISQLPPSTTQAEEDARLLAQEDQQRKAEEEARMQAENELLRQEEEEIAKQQAEEEARMQADHEPERLESEAVTRTMAEEQARIQAEQEPARWEAEAQARSQAEEEARLQAERETNDVVGGTVEEPTTGSSSLIDQPDPVVVDVMEPLEYPNAAADVPVDGDQDTTAHTTPEDSKKSSLDTPVSDMVAEIVDFVVEQLPEAMIASSDDAVAHENVTENKEETQESLQENEVPAELVADTNPVSTNDETAKQEEMPELEEVVNNVGAVPLDVPEAVNPLSPPPESVAIGDETVQAETSDKKLESSNETQATDNGDATDAGIAVDIIEVHASAQSPSTTANLEGTAESENDLSSTSNKEEAKDKSAPDATEKSTEEPSADSSTVESKVVSMAPPTASEQVNHDSTADTSLPVIEVTKTKRVSSLVSKYMDNVKRDSLPGDTAKLESSAKGLTFSPSPGTPKATIELQDLPKIDDIRAKFEGSAKSSQPHVFEFGEAFRQKQRFSLLADREKKREAQMKLHGYDELILTKASSASGEVDSSSIEKTFSFQTSNEDVSLHDGTCKIDYKNETYKGMVFVVHRTRGMLVFNRVDLSGNESNNLSGTHIPGGPVSEEEYLAAAKLTGYAKMQLQLAAREGAARQLFEMTGIDIRQKLDRLTPAVLQMNPPVDAKGIQYLKNEHENNLYYFLQISDDDFVSEDTNDTILTAPSGELESPLKLRLSRGFADFTFIKDPVVAVEELKENGDPSVTAALSMVMNQSVGPDGEPAKATLYEGATEVQTVLVPRDEQDVWNIGLTTVRADVDSNKVDTPNKADNPILRTDNEADLQPKASVDTEQEVVVDCCCGSFW